MWQYPSRSYFSQKYRRNSPILNQTGEANGRFWTLKQPFPDPFLSTFWQVLARCIEEFVVFWQEAGFGRTRKHPDYAPPPKTRPRQKRPAAPKTGPFMYETVSFVRHLGVMSVRLMYETVHNRGSCIEK